MEKLEKEKKPRIIKRYQNRKLYDTRHSCYVTLDDIEGLIKNGEDLCVIDNRTGEDLTSVTLTQIILEEEKKKRNILPIATLKNIIQSGGEQIAQLLQKSIQTVSAISNVKDGVIDKIKDEIEDSSSFIRDFLTKSHQGVDEFSKKLEGRFKLLGRFTNIPLLRTQIRSLRKKVAILERKLRQFEK